MVVDQVTKALASSSPTDDHNMEGTLMDTDESYFSDELADDMVLGHYQNELKKKSLARNGPSASGTTHKKGRNSPHS